MNFPKKINFMATKNNYFFVSAILVMFTSAMSYSRSGTAMPTTHIHTYIYIHFKVDANTKNENAQKLYKNIVYNYNYLHLQ